MVITWFEQIFIVVHEYSTHGTQTCLDDPSDSQDQRWARESNGGSRSTLTRTHGELASNDDKFEVTVIKAMKVFTTKVFHAHVQNSDNSPS